MTTLTLAEAVAELKRITEVLERLTAQDESERYDDAGADDPRAG